nr:uncharacterized protein C1orf105 homolog isoform X2 [Oryctolagus cuniculus]
MEKTELKASVPKFDKVPWPGEASLRNKPLVLSLPKRSPHSYAIFPTSSKDMNLSILFHVPDVFSKVRKNQNNSMLLPNKPLCSTCQEISMIQSRPLRIPDGLKLSFKNFVSHREHSLQTAHSGPQDSCLPWTSLRCLQKFAGDGTNFFTQEGTNRQDSEDKMLRERTTSPRQSLTLTLVPSLDFPHLQKDDSILLSKVHCALGIEFQCF